jgi:hypothetical protein
MGLAYRASQFWRLLKAPPLPNGAWQEIGTILSSDELTLFRRFSRGDQQHAYRVMRTLLAAGNDEPALLVAALLHDVGKTRYRIHLWERVAGALAELFFPETVERWGNGEARGWRRPLVIRQQHASWSAEMASAAGSTPLAVALMRHHQDRQLDDLDGELARLLRLLQRADDQN